MAAATDAAVDGVTVVVEGAGEKTVTDGAGEEDEGDNGDEADGETAGKQPARGAEKYGVARKGEEQYDEELDDGKN